MLLIPTELRQSPIHGVGVFYTGKEPIPAGNLIWFFQEGFDQRWAEEEILNFPEQAQIHCYYNVWRSKVTGLYLLCADNLKYVNHAYTPNTEFCAVPRLKEPACFSRVVIGLGDEIVQNYQEFDSVGESELWEKLEIELGIQRSDFDKEVYG
jgi:hypothetical protein